MILMLDRLVDAQAMARKHPATFEAPTPAELASIRVGGVVKICRNGERFWVLVTHRSGEAVTGEVENHLIYNDDLSVGTKVSFATRYIFAIG